MPFSLSADLEFITSRLDRKEEVGYLVQASISKAKQLEAEVERLSGNLIELRLQYADLKAKYDKMSSENKRWQDNWDANVQEMSEKFRAVNVARVMAGTNTDLLARATVAEAENTRLTKALEPFSRAADCHSNDKEFMPDAMLIWQGGECAIRLGDLRAARALARKKAGNKRSGGTL